MSNLVDLTGLWNCTGLEIHGYSWSFGESSWKIRDVKHGGSGQISLQNINPYWCRVGLLEKGNDALLREKCEKNNKWNNCLLSLIDRTWISWQIMRHGNILTSLVDVGKILEETDVLRGLSNHDKSSGSDKIYIQQYGRSICKTLHSLDDYSEDWNNYTPVPWL